MDLVEKYLGEISKAQKKMKGSTKDAFKSLMAILKALETDNPDKMSKDAEEIWDQAEGIKDYFNKEGSFTKGQAEWIFKTWQGFKRKQKK